MKARMVRCFVDLDILDIYISNDYCTVCGYVWKRVWCICIDNMNTSENKLVSFQLKAPTAFHGYVQVNFQISQTGLQPITRISTT